jgi:predicted O-methyltransferase YrrM
MTGNIINNLPVAYEKISERTAALDFRMGSDLLTGTLLKTLAASKPGGRFLELGTGTGLATAWIAAGLDDNSSLLTIDNNELLSLVAREHITDDRVEFLLADAYEWILQNRGQSFDLVFADAVPGKYELLDETLAMLNRNGFYVVDDLLPQENWPVGHEENVNDLLEKLDERSDLVITRLDWSTGILIAVKR